MTGSDGLHGAGFGAGDPDAYLPMADGAAVADHDISGGAIRRVRTMDCRSFFFCQRTLIKAVKCSHEMKNMGINYSI